MAGKHSIEVQVLAETRKAANALKNFSRDAGLDKLGEAAKRAGKAVAVGVAAIATGAGVYVGKAIGHAGNLEQSMGAVDSVFKDGAGQMHEWAKSAAQSAGLSQNAYNELATVLGTQLKNGGTALDEIGGKTNDLVGLGADLASMFGGTTADAVGALSSALKGERDPIERYGVSLKQATIDAKAAELGFEKVGGSLSNEAQQAATLALIMEQTADAHGNFAKEADTVQGKQARLAAQWENLSARIGTAFLPAVAAVADFAAQHLMPVLEDWGTKITTWVGPALEQLGGWLTSTVLPALQTFGTWIQTNIVPTLGQWATIATTQLWPALQSIGQWLINASGWLIPLAAGIGGMVLAYQAWTIATSAWTAVTTIATTAQKLLNLVLKANPIGIVVTLIAGLIAAGIALYQNNEKVREVVNKAWAAIKGAISAVANWITNTAWPAIRGAWDALSGATKKLYDAIKTQFDNARNAIASFKDRTGQLIQNVIQFFKDLPNKTISAISGLGGRLQNSASTFMQNMANGFSSRLSAVIGFFSGLPGKITSALAGLPSQLHTAGRNTLQGFINGAKAMAGRLADAVLAPIRNAVDGAKRFLGIRSPSRLFRTIGEQTGQGLEIGLESWTSRVARAATGMASAVAANGVPDPLPLAGSYAPGRARSGINLTVNVQTLMPTPDTGRQIAKALRPYLQNGGALI